MPRKKKQKEVGVINETNSVKSFLQGSVVLQPGANILAVDDWEAIRDTRTIRKMSIKNQISITHNNLSELIDEPEETDVEDNTEENATD